MRTTRTIKPLPEMEADMLQEMQTKGRKKIYKEESAEFKKEELALDLQKAIQTINTNIVRVNFNDPDDVRQRISDYFVACSHTGQIPSVLGLSVHGFGLSRQALNRWRLKKENASSESARLIDMACDTIADCVSNQAMKNNINSIMGIFMLKNCHGFQDRVEVAAVPADDTLTTTKDDIFARAGLLDDE